MSLPIQFLDFLYEVQQKQLLSSHIPSDLNQNSV